MAIPGNASVVVVWGYWVDEVTGLGVKQPNGSPATISFTPVRLDGSVNTSPNLRDIDAQAWVKTRTRTAAVNAATGYFAALLVANNDPDLDAYAGRRVSFLGEEPFTVAVPHDAPVITVDGNMSDRTGLPLGTPVRGLPLTLLPRVGSEIDFWVEDAYLNAGQVTNAIAAAVAAHNSDPTAHLGLVGGGGGGGGLTQTELDNAIAGHANSATPHPVYDALTLVTAFEGGLV